MFDFLNFHFFTIVFTYPYFWYWALWFLCMRSYHCISSLLNLQRSLGALKLYTATESYLLCVSGVSCHGEKIPFEVWPPSFTLTIMLLALSCPPCKAHVFSFVRLPLPHSCTPPGFPLLCHSLSHCYPFAERRSGPNLIPPRHAGKCSRSLGIVGSAFRTLLISASWKWIDQRSKAVYSSTQNSDKRIVFFKVKFKQTSFALNTL